MDQPDLRAMDQSAKDDLIRFLLAEIAPILSGNLTQAGRQPAARLGPILSGGNPIAHHGTVDLS